MSLLCSLVQRRVAQLVLSINANSGFQELFDHASRSKVGSHVQRTVASLGHCIQICSIGCQDFGHIGPILLSTQMDRRQTILKTRTNSMLGKESKLTFVLFTLAWALTSALCLISSFTISTWPSWAARWRGLKPALLSASVLAPYSKRLAAMSSWFFLAVMWRGV